MLILLTSHTLRASGGSPASLLAAVQAKDLLCLRRLRDTAVSEVVPEVDDLLANPYWSALATEQAGVALGGALARRFPVDVIPFAGVPQVSAGSLEALRALLAPGERVLVTSDVALAHPGLAETEAMPGLQMICTPEAQANAVAEKGQVERLGPADVPAMLALKAIAFPGYFGPRAASLGSFYGVHVRGELAAMCGERLHLPGWREISALCTHPDHTGQGYAAMLLRCLMHEHREAGLRSFLGVDARNARAISLYARLGFVESRKLVWRWVERVG